MNERANDQHRSVLQALFVTLLWSSSWVLIKWGLADIPPLTFAALRYSLAAALLLAWFGFRYRTRLRSIGRSMRSRLVLLGIFYYALAQGSLFVALDNLPAVTVNLILSFTSVIVGLAAVPLLNEPFTRRQVGGVGLAVAGACTYFFASAPTGTRASLVGFSAAVLGLLSNATAVLLGRSVNREGTLEPGGVTAISMSIGAAIMLAVAMPVSGLPPLSAKNWFFIIWLAVVNTAFAFTLWNHTLRTLSALESSMINSSMMIQIPILALIFLGESLDAAQVLGLALTVCGIYLVQRWSKAGRPEQAPQMGR
ncbi:MAG: DMT family transporter [Anaerolineales bacterium]